MICKMPKTQELPGGAAPGPPAVRTLRLLRSLRSNFQVFWQGVTCISVFTRVPVVLTEKGIHCEEFCC